MSDQHSSHLITFANPKPERDFEIEIINPEFTCLCPVTGQPDFAIFRLRYIADEACLELKGLKLYFGSFRNVGCFHEAVTNQVLDDFVAAVSPRAMVVEAVSTSEVEFQLGCKQRTAMWVSSIRFRLSRA
jgi:7-cyano-7-deazaguanine reductase